MGEKAPERREKERSVCARSCPTDALELDGEEPSVGDTDACVSCGEETPSKTMSQETAG
ncbi:MAG: hypothetical protein M1358_13530 [Chloroflexi bacterium]|nr:hypothetical protein [Chloroflexota bacterium]